MRDNSHLTRTLLRNRPGLALIGLGIAALDLLAVYGFLGQRLYPLNPVWIYLLLYSIAFGIYLYAAGRLLPAIPRRDARFLLPLILGGAALFRLAVVFAPPQLSTDIFLYVWDGRLINHGINPYHWAPNAQPLRYLRDSIWNEAEYKGYQSIYMPVSQAVFAAAYALFGSNAVGYKFLYMLFDFGVIGLLLVILKRLGRPLTQVIWYAWCPLPITEVSLAGHQDIVGVFFLLLAFALAMRSQKNVPWIALTLVAAVMTKGFALLLLPLFARGAWPGVCGLGRLWNALSGNAPLGLFTGVSAWDAPVFGECPCECRAVRLGQCGPELSHKALALCNYGKAVRCSDFGCDLLVGAAACRLLYGAAAPVVCRSCGGFAGPADAVSVVPALDNRFYAPAGPQAFVFVCAADGAVGAAVYVLYCLPSLLVGVGGRIQPVLCASHLGALEGKIKCA